MDQWGLLVIATYVCKILAETPDIWRQSFIATNLHPHHRISFHGWYKKIKGVLAAGLCYESEKTITAESLLPEWYKVWPSERKAKAFELMSTGNWGDLQTIKALCKLTGLHPSKIPEYQTCFLWKYRQVKLTLEHRQPMRCQKQYRLLAPGSLITTQMMDSLHFN